MGRARTESEVVALQKLAEQIARQRGEPTTTAHLLAALAVTPSAAKDLLSERKVDSAALLAAAAGYGEESKQSLAHAITRARELARRVPTVGPTPSQLLVALTSQRRTAAHHALERCGVDVARLRSAAMTSGLGLVRPRRVVGQAAQPTRQPRDTALPRKPRGVAVPIVPPVAKPGSRAKLPPATSPPTGNGAQAAAASQVPPHPAADKVAPAPRSAPAAAGWVDTAAQGRKTPAARTPALGRTDTLALDPDRFPTLCALGTNLTLAAARGELDLVVGRDAEVEQALDVLAKRHGNSPCLVGRSGVGKTSVVRGLAARIARSEQLACTDDRIIVEISASELIAGTGVRGALAGRIAALRQEVQAAQGRVVLFFDEIHQLFTGDAAEELATELKPSLARGELPCIGAATPEEYRKAIESDPPLARRFTRIEVEEPGREDAFLILDAVCERLGAHHGVRYSPEALALCVNWSIRYLPNQALPDKAISVADLAGARSRRRGKTEVHLETIAEVVSELGDVPVERLLQTDSERMLNLEQLLQGRVFGHDAQLARIARILRRNAAGLGAHRPLGTFLLLGPTGVGKTETAKAVAEVLFHNQSAMTRIDLSEYGEAHSVARLLGAPPGYVGHEAGGQLTEAVRRRPYQVILLDEIEKAHPDVLVAFLPVFDEGRLTDGRGRSVDFTNCIILMTSNLGAEASGSSPKRRVGFGSDEAPDAAQLERGVVAAARSTLAPELYNRIDEVLVFSPLTRTHVTQIARRLLADMGRALASQHGIVFEAEEAAIERLLEAGGFDPSLGARPMRRTIARLVEAPLAERILRGDLKRGDVALLTVLDNELQLDALDAVSAAPSGPLH